MPCLPVRLVLVTLPVLIIMAADRSNAADPNAGKTKFLQVCATCHGNTGLGDGPASTAYNPRPKNLQTTELNDKQLHNVIANGGPAEGLSPLMLGWKAMLKPEEIDNIIAYLRKLGKQAQEKKNKKSE